MFSHFRIAPPNTALILCFCIHFLTALDTLMLVPFSAKMALDSGTDPANAGYLLSVYAVAAAICCFTLKSTLSLQRERRRVIGLTCAMATVSGLTIYTRDFTDLLCLRAIAGAIGGTLAVVNINYVLINSEDSQKKKNLSLLLSTLPLALSVGVPAVVWSGLPWQDIFKITTVCLVFLSLAGVVITQLNEALPTTEKTQASPKGVVNARVWFSLGLISSAILGTFVISTQFPVMLTVTMQISHSGLGLSYMCGGVITFIAMQVYARSQVEVCLGKVLLIFSLLMVLATLLGFNTPSTYIASCAFGCFIAVSALRTLVLTTEVVHRLAPAERLTMVSQQNAVQHLALAIGSALGSALLAPSRTPGHPPANTVLDYSQLLAFACIFMMLPWFIWRLGNTGEKDKARI